MAKKPPVQPKAPTYPEKGTFTEAKLLKKHIKGLTDAQVVEWCELEGLTFKPCVEHAPIHRMRAAMAIGELHFPSEKKPSAKAESPYKKWTTDALIAMAVEKNIPVEVTDDMKILRMRCIMMLRAHGIIG